MTRTSHGHHIDGTTFDDEGVRVPVARCGGPKLCSDCKNEATAVHQPSLPDPQEREFFEDTSEYGDDPDRFLKQAKLFVISAYNNRIDEDENELTVKDLYIVWFAKTLGNWKALISTSIPDDGLYFEVTHNGGELETYVDTYMKIANDKFSQEGDDRE